MSDTRLGVVCVRARIRPALADRLPQERHLVLPSSPRSVPIQVRTTRETARAWRSRPPTHSRPASGLRLRRRGSARRLTGGEAPSSLPSTNLHAGAIDSYLDLVELAVGAP